MIRHLAAWLKLAYVQRRIRQSNEARDSQENASRQLQDVNERLDRLHPEICECVADYERRIAGLERKLKGANDFTRQLIESKIFMVRKELEIERAKSNLVWNCSAGCSRCFSPALILTNG